MLLSLTLLLGLLSSQTTKPSPEEDLFLPKGTLTRGLIASVGIAHEIFDGVGDAEIVYLGGHIGRVLSNPVGPGFLRGNLALDVEVFPVVLVFQEDASYAISATLVGRHYLKTSSGVRPFLSFGAGFLWSSADLPPGTSQVNFTPQIGFGIAFAHGPRQTYVLEYRLHHISNADLVMPNPGINSSLIQFRTTFFRPRKQAR